MALWLLLAMAPAAAALPPYALPVAGRTERARVEPGGLMLEAKLDTGARTSSLHAANLQFLTRDGQDRVAFDVVDDGGRSVHIDRPLVRIAKIKSAPGIDEARPVVTLGICIGNIYRLTEVNLVDRSTLDKPLLIGRSFLRGRLQVNVNRRYLLEPACAQKIAP